MSTSHVPGNEIGRMNIKTPTGFKGLTYKHMSKSITGSIVEIVT